MLLELVFGAFSHHLPPLLTPPPPLLTPYVGQYVDAGGSVPSKIWNRQMGAVMAQVCRLREKFQRDDEIDEGTRAGVKRTLEREQSYTAEEEGILYFVEESMKLLVPTDFKPLDSPDHRVKMSEVLFAGDRLATGCASTVVDAEIADVAGWELDKMSRHLTAEHFSFGGSKRDFLKVNEHHYIFRGVYDLAKLSGEKRKQAPKERPPCDLHALLPTSFVHTCVCHFVHTCVWQGSVPCSPASQSSRSFGSGSRRRDSW